MRSSLTRLAFAMSTTRQFSSLFLVEDSLTAYVPTPQSIKNRRAQRVEQMLLIISYANEPVAHFARARDGT